MLLGVLALALLSPRLLPEADVDELAYSELKTLVAEGKVEEIKLNNNTLAISGTLKDGTEFTSFVQAPGPTEDDLALFEENDPPVILPIGDTPMNSLIILELAGDSAGSILLKVAFGDFYYLASGIEEFFTLLHDRAD